MAAAKTYLSKSQFKRGMQCIKSLWLYKYKQDVLQESDEKSDFTETQLVKKLACKLFSSGKKIQYLQSKNGKVDYPGMLAQTKQWIDEGVKTIYNATFEHDDIFVTVDMLHKTRGGWEMYDVEKSSWNEEASKPKKNDKFIDDISIQHYVLSALGYKVKKCFITMLNSNYTFQDKLEIDKLFVHVDVTGEVVGLQADIPTYMRTFQRVLDDKTNEPDIDIGMHCFKPKECDAYEYCWKTQRNIPEYSVFDIFNMGDKVFELYNRGVLNIEDIPDDAITTVIQRLAVDSWLYKSIHVDKESIEDFLSGIKYPIYHLDFETYQDTIPQFNGQKPYQQIPFQYSLHIEHKNGKLEHKEFLAKEGTDPREALIKRLIADIPANACVLAYASSFEKGRLIELSDNFPEYGSRLMEIHDNILDLAEPFQKRHYYHYSLLGKYSIKLIMPLLVPDMADAYEKLELVQNGGDAMNVFPKLIDMQKPERQKYRNALLEYCKLDTLSMVKVLEKLKEMVG